MDRQHFTAQEMADALRRVLRAGAVADGIDPDNIEEQDVMFLLTPEERDELADMFGGAA